MSGKTLVPAIIDLPDIGEAIESAFSAIMGMIAGALNTVFGWFWEAILVMFTSTPAPVTDSQNTSFSENPSAVFYTCGDSQLNCNAVWQNTYDFYSETAKPMGIIFLVIGIMMSQATKPMQGMFPSSFGGTGADRVAERAVLGIIGIQLWWTIGTLVLEIALGMTQGIVSFAMGSGAGSPNGLGSGTLAVIIIAIIIYCVAISTILIVLLFWVLRYVAIFMLMGGMPIIIGLWAFKIGPLESISDFATKIGGTFTPLAFATVPAALVIAIGQIMTDFGSSTIGSGSLGGTALAVVTFIIGAFIPVLAGTIPMWFFNENQNAVRDVQGKIQGKVNQAQQHYDTASSRHATMKREGSAARSAMGGGPAIKYTQDEDGNTVAREVDDMSEASSGYRAMRGLMSGGNKAQDVARASAELGGDAMFKPKATAAAGMTIGQNAYRDKKDSLSNSIEETKSAASEKGKKTMAKGYLAGVDAKDWAEDKQAQSDMDVYHNMEARRDFASTAARGAASTAGGAAADRAFRSDADPTNPQLVGDDGDVIESSSGEAVLAEEVGDTYKEGEGGRPVTSPDGQAVEAGVVTSPDGETLTNDRGETINENETYKYEQTSDGDFNLDDRGKPIPKEAVPDSAGGDPIKDDSQGNYVTPKRVQEGEFLSSKEAPEASGAKKVTVMTETGPEKRAVALDEDGKAMVRDEHRFETDN